LGWAVFFAGGQNVPGRKSDQSGTSEQSGVKLLKGATLSFLSILPAIFAETNFDYHYS
jgi:hypothetical protein